MTMLIMKMKITLVLLDNNSNSTCSHTSQQMLCVWGTTLVLPRWLALQWVS